MRNGINRLDCLGHLKPLDRPTAVPCRQKHGAQSTLLHTPPETPNNRMSTVTLANLPDKSMVSDRRMPRPGKTRVTCIQPSTTAKQINESSTKQIAYTYIVGTLPSVSTARPEVGVSRIVAGAGGADADAGAGADDDMVSWEGQQVSSVWMLGCCCECRLPGGIVQQNECLETHDNSASLRLWHAFGMKKITLKMRRKWVLLNITF